MSRMDASSPRAPDSRQRLEQAGAYSLLAVRGNTIVALREALWQTRAPLGCCTPRTTDS
jgi:hypothetical protein